MPVHGDTAQSGTLFKVIQCERRVILIDRAAGITFQYVDESQDCASVRIRAGARAAACINAPMVAYVARRGSDCVRLGGPKLCVLALYRRGPIVALCDCHERIDEDIALRIRIPRHGLLMSRVKILRDIAKSVRSARCQNMSCSSVRYGGAARRLRMKSMLILPKLLNVSTWKAGARSRPGRPEVPLRAGSRGRRSNGTTWGTLVRRCAVLSVSSRRGTRRHAWRQNGYSDVACGDREHAVFQALLRTFVGCERLTVPAARL